MELQRGDLFTAVLLSKEELIEKFSGSDNKLIRHNINVLSDNKVTTDYGALFNPPRPKGSDVELPPVYRWYTNMGNTGGVQHPVFILPSLLNKASTLLCKCQGQSRHAVHKSCSILFIDNPIVGADERVDQFLGFNQAILPLIMLVDIKKVTYDKPVIII